MGKLIRNCINCGAPLTDFKCSYCGTEYKDEMPIAASFDGYNSKGTLTIAGQTFDVYLNEVTVEYNDYGAIRGLDSRLCRPVVNASHKFTLITR